MEQLSAVREVVARSTYISSDEQPENYWCEGEPSTVQIERTDDNEIRVGIQIRGNSSDDATVYLSRSEAIRFVLALASAIGDR